jgi:hypothetical protein
MKPKTKLMLIALAAGVFLGAGASAKYTSNNVYAVTRQFGNNPPMLVFVQKPKTTIGLFGQNSKYQTDPCCALRSKRQLQVDPHGGVRVFYVKPTCNQ